MRAAEAQREHGTGALRVGEAAAAAGKGPMHDGGAAGAAGHDIDEEAVALDDDGGGVDASARGSRCGGLKRRALRPPLPKREDPEELPRADLGRPSRRPRGGVNAGRDTSYLPPGEEAGLFFAGQAPNMYSYRCAARRRSMARPRSRATYGEHTQRGSFEPKFLCTLRARTSGQLNLPLERGIFEVDIWGHSQTHALLRLAR